MANTIINSVKFIPLCSNLLKANKYGFSVLSLQRIQNLYSQSALGIDGFIQQKEKTKHIMANISEKFRTKMTEFTEEGSKNMIFTEDLKNMIHLAESEKDVELVIKMLKRFNQQNQQLRFGSFIFGPVVMRMLYCTNKPDLALESFKSPELDGIFDQLSTYQILLDLLYENQKYNEVLEAYQLIRDRQIEGIRFPKNVVVLTMAACYKLNTPESFAFVKKMWQDVLDSGHVPMRRAVTFLATLAIHQNEPGMALEVISNTRNQNYTTIRNIKAWALTDLGRVEDAVHILKNILAEDLAEGPRQTFNQEIIKRVQAAVEKAQNPELLLEFERIVSIFAKEGHITEGNLDEQLCKEIEQSQKPHTRPRDFIPDRRQSRPRPGGFNQRPSSRPDRPGLADLN